jgi:hypothetical protein
VTVTVDVAEAVHELTVNGGTAGQFVESPAPGAIAFALALLLFCGAPVVTARLLLVIAGTVAVACNLELVFDPLEKSKGSIR